MFSVVPNCIHTGELALSVNSFVYQVDLDSEKNFLFVVQNKIRINFYKCLLPFISLLQVFGTILLLLIKSKQV